MIRQNGVGRSGWVKTVVLCLAAFAITPLHSLAQTDMPQVPEPEKRPASVPARTPVALNHKPNVVFILADNVGYGDSGVYGGELRGAPTPRTSTNWRARACGSPSFWSSRPARRRGRR